MVPRRSRCQGVRNTDLLPCGRKERTSDEEIAFVHWRGAVHPINDLTDRKPCAIELRQLDFDNRPVMIDQEELRSSFDRRHVIQGEDHKVQLIIHLIDSD